MTATYCTADDPKVEKCLANMGLKWEKIDVPVNSIDLNWSKTNYGRTGRAIDSDSAEDYGLAMLEGDTFPRIVVCPITKKKTGRWVGVLGGMHREAGAREAGATALGAYLVNPDVPGMEIAISVSLNRLEGIRNSRGAAVAEAVTLVGMGLEVQQVCRWFKVNPTTVRGKLRAKEIEDQLRAAGFLKILPESALRNLAILDSNTKVLIATAEYVALTGIAADAIPRFTADVRRYKTEAQQLAFIEKESAKLLRERDRKQQEDEEPDGKIPPAAIARTPRRRELLKSLHAFQRLVTTYPSCAKLQIIRGSDDHKDIKKDWAEAKKAGDRALGN